ncbi:MAG: hypothetical protein ACKO96_36880 [Flammeovirgaceae bacterium]
MNTKDDEIDLLDLGVKLIRFFKRFFWQLIIIAIAGASIGFAFYSFVPKEYESKMLIKSDKITYSLRKSLIEDLNQLAREKSWDTLGKKLGLSPTDAENIVAIRIKSLNDKLDPLKDTDKNSLFIAVRSYDLKFFTIIQNGIEKYLNENPFTAQLKKMKADYYESIIGQYNQQIDKLQNQQAQFDAGKLYAGAKDPVYYFDPSVFSSRILSCELEKLKYQDSLKLIRNIKIMSGFTQFQKPVFPRLDISLMVGVILSYLTVAGFYLLKRVN